MIDPMIDLSTETQLLARRLAEAQHATVDDVVNFALRACASGLTLHPRGPSSQATDARCAALAAFRHQIAAMPVLDQRSLQAILDDLNDA